MSAFLSSCTQSAALMVTKWITGQVRTETAWAFVFLLSGLWFTIRAGVKEREDREKRKAIEEKRYSLQHQTEYQDVAVFPLVKLSHWAVTPSNSDILLLPWQSKMRSLKCVYLPQLFSVTAVCLLSRSHLLLPSHCVQMKEIHCIEMAIVLLRKKNPNTMVMFQV